MNLAALDHDRHVRRAVDLAATAAERGDDPYGSLLVRDGEVVAEAGNRVHTGDDLALHPELTLARRAAREATPGERARTVMYASTEPCPMCATGIAYAGLGAVVYSVSGARVREELRGAGDGEGGSEETGGGGDGRGGGEQADDGAGDEATADVPEGIPCGEVFERLGCDIEVVGPVLESEGLELHRTYSEP